jgi:hypothetical protein
MWGHETPGAAAHGGFPTIPEHFPKIKEDARKKEEGFFLNLKNASSPNVRGLDESLVARARKEAGGGTCALWLRFQRDGLNRRKDRLRKITEFFRQREFPCRTGGGRPGKRCATRKREGGSSHGPPEG